MGTESTKCTKNSTHKTLVRFCSVSATRLRSLFFVHFVLSAPNSLYLFYHFVILNVMNFNNFNPIDFLQNFSLSLPIGLRILFLIICVIYVILTVILMFHWKRYGAGNLKIVFAEVVYLAGSAIIFMVMFSSLILI